MKQLARESKDIVVYIQNHITGTKKSKAPTATEVLH